jgi:hypothetical protein
LTIIRGWSLPVGVLLATLLASGCSSSTPTVSEPSDFLTAVRVTPPPSASARPSPSPSPTPTAEPTARPVPGPTPQPSPTSTPSPEPPPQQGVLTAEDNGGTFRLGIGDHLLVRLGEEGMNWSDLESSSAAVTVVERLFLVDPGYREWEVTGVRNGEATLTAVGNRPCRDAEPPCAAPSALFKVTIVVD